MSSKKKTLKQHARRRAYERFGIRLTKEAHRQIVRAINTNSATVRFIGRQSLRVSGFLVEIEGKLMKVLYDRKRKCLITVLPEGAIWEYEERSEPITEGGGTLSAHQSAGRDSAQEECCKVIVPCH